MKSLLRLSAITSLAIGLSSPAFSQVWFESVSNNSMTFVVRATTGSASDAQTTLRDVYESGAGARFTLTFDSVNRSIFINVTNLSATPDSNSTNTRTVSVDPLGSAAARNITFQEGEIIGFGFETRSTSALPLNLTSGVETTTSTYNVSGVSGTDSSVPNVFLDPLQFSHAPAYNTEAGVYRSSNQSTWVGIGAGQGASYRFNFANTGDGSTTGNYSSSLFNNSAFWSSNSSTDADFVVVFNGTKNSKGWDKVAVSFDNLPIPEPSTYGLIGAGALVALAANRRRRSAAVAK